jgi:hypothetical protein
MLVNRSIASGLGIMIAIAIAGTGCASAPSDASSDSDATSAAAPKAKAGAAKPASTPPPAGASAPSGSSGASPPEAPGFKPAFTPSVPRLQNGGGPVLAHPKIVTVTFGDDPNADLYESLDDAIGGTSYFHSITSEYGVGAGVSGGHVRERHSLRGIDSDAIGDLVAARVTDPSSGWPAPSPDTVYVLYTPSTASITTDGTDLCSLEGGHHTSTSVNGSEVAYAVVLQCADDDGAIDVSEITLIASHEIGEASVDPFATTLAWATIDDDHIAWDLMLAFQNENGDLCEFFPEAPLESPEPALPVTVQREWSNASAAAGHNPCVPAPPEPYFNVTPLRSDPITVDLTELVNALADADFTDTSKSGTQHTQGLLLDAQGTGVVDIGFFSDAPTDAWTLEVFEMDPFAVLDGGEELFPRASDPSVAVSLDHTTGKNGDKATLTVQRTGSTRIGAALLILQSTLAGTTHQIPLLVALP